MFLPILQDAKGDDNEMATDNALSALVALLEHHSDVCNGDQMVELLVAGLPLKSDAVEAQKVNDYLVKRLEVSDNAADWGVRRKSGKQLGSGNGCRGICRLFGCL